MTVNVALLMASYSKNFITVANLVVKAGYVSALGNIWDVVKEQWYNIVHFEMFLWCNANCFIWEVYRDGDVMSRGYSPQWSGLPPSVARSRSRENTVSDPNPATNNTHHHHRITTALEANGHTLTLPQSMHCSCIVHALYNSVGIILLRISLVLWCWSLSLETDLSQCFLHKLILQILLNVACS